MPSSVVLSPSSKAAPSWIKSVAEALSSILSSESSVGYRRAGYGLLALFVPLEIFECVLGAPPMAGPWDVVLLLDGGWRLLNGQVFHSNFYNPNGVLTYLLIAFGMKVAPLSTSSITYGMVLLATVLLPLAWHIATKRLSSGASFVFTALAGIYLLSPRPPGYLIRVTTYAMIYNREGYVIIALFLVCLFLSRRDSRRESFFVDGAIAGFLLGLLLFCKITYFAAAIGVTPIAVLFFPKPRAWFLAALGTLAGVCAALWVFFRISLYGYLMDVKAALPVQSKSVRVSLLLEGLSNNASLICLLFLFLLLWAWVQDESGGIRGSFVRICITAAAIVAAALLIVSGNTSQGGGIDDPLYFVAALICLELFRRQNAAKVARVGTPARFTYTASFVLLFLVLLGPLLCRDLASYAYVAKWDLRWRPTLSASQRLDAYTLRDFYVPPSTEHITAYWPARDYPARINDGIELLRRHLRKGDRLTTLAYVNPFNFALGLTPAHEGRMWWDLHVTFDLTHYPSPENFLSDSSLVIVPRLLDRRTGYSFETADVMMELYGGYLHDHFHKVESTEIWALYRRN